MPADPTARVHRLTRENLFAADNSSAGVLTHVYDKVGNLKQLTYPGGRTVLYDYDHNNRLITVTDWNSRITSFGYDLAGRLTSITRPNNTVRSMGYDAVGRLSEIREIGPGGAGISYSKLNFDEAGRPLNEFNAPIPGLFVESPQTVGYDADWACFDKTDRERWAFG
jgi:YD repeat-containing protein